VLSVPVENDRAMTAVVRRLDEAGIGVIELSLHLPSLDEVFFTLTRGSDAGPGAGAVKKEQVPA